MEPEKELMRFAFLISRSIDPRRPRLMNEEQKAMVKTLPLIGNLPCLPAWPDRAKLRSIRRLSNNSGIRNNGDNDFCYATTTVVNYEHADQTIATINRRNHQPHNPWG